jgi:hypothetical protein
MDKIIGTIGVFLAVAILVGLIISFPVMLLWNGCLVPAITGVNEIGWMQAWGLTVLSTVFFKTTVTKGSQ